MILAGWVFMSLGTVLVVIGSIGMLRFRDVFSRLQASGVSDNAGLSLILLGLMLRSGTGTHNATLLLLLLLLLITNPIVTHSIARSAFVQRHREEREP